MATTKRPAPGTRAAAFGVALLAVIAFAGCSGSSKHDNATATTPTTTSSSDTGATTGSTSKKAKGANAKTCADIEALRSTPGVDAIGGDLAKGKQIFRDFQQKVDKLAKDAPPELAADAKTLRDAVHQLRSAVDNAKSVDELQNEAATNAELKSVVSDLTAVGPKVEAWAAANC
jgi:hypothetical protein